MMALVTGGAGFIGSHTVDLLLSRGWDVRILDNLDSRVHPRGQPPYLPSGVELVVGDATCREDLLRALEDVDVVFHLAACEDYLTDFRAFTRGRVESAALLFEIIAERQLAVRKIVFASSQAVAGDGAYHCVEHGTLLPGPRPLNQLERGEWEIVCPACMAAVEPQLIDEGTVNPRTTYAVANYAAELLAEHLGHLYRIPTVCMRYAHVQGPRKSVYGACAGISRILAMPLLRQLPPVLYEDGRQLRDPVDVRDVAAANLLVAERDEADFDVYNVGGGRAMRVHEFAEAALRVLGSDLQPVIGGGFQPGDRRHAVSDISKLRRLGWAPSIPIEESLRECVEWLRMQHYTDEFLHEAHRLLHSHRPVRATQATQTA